MFRCIASDMDGTLLNHVQEISKENYLAIMAAKENGIEIIIATGRGYDEAVSVLQNAGISCPMICSNGAFTCDEHGNEIFSNPLIKKDIRKITNLLDKEGLYYEVSTNLGVFAKDKDNAEEILINIYHSVKKEIDLTLIKQRVERRFSNGIKKIDNYYNLFRDPSVKIFKLLVFSKDICKLQYIKNELNESQNVTVTSSSVENIEISHALAQKGLALERYLKELDIGLHETMVIGDSHNDLSMFEKAGFAVAMGNASNKIKKQADFVTDTNDNSGVAKAISIITSVPILS